jgi:hypothetical protein
MNNLTLGWELEVEGVVGRRDVYAAAKQHAAVLGDALRHVTTDCTLRDNGAEIVSEPLTLDGWRARRKATNTLLRSLQRDGFTSHRGHRCGFHVHVGRNELSADALVRVVELVYGNRAEWEALSARKDFEWCYFVDDYSLRLERDYARRAKYDTDNTEVRGYMKTAVRMSYHDTVEFRLWRGSLRIARFWRNLELTHAACSFAGESSAAPTFDQFQQYLAANATTYPHVKLEPAPCFT